MSSPLIFSGQLAAYKPLILGAVVGYLAYGGHLPSLPGGLGQLGSAVVYGGAVYMFEQKVESAVGLNL